MNTQKTWDNFVAAIKADIPGFEFRYKTESTLFKLLQKVFWFVNQASYTTTVFPYIYWATKESEEAMHLSTLEHEWVHLKDCRTFFGQLPGALWPLNLLMFMFLYAFPQILGVLAALAIVAAFTHNPWWLLWLLALVFCAPWPSPTRAWIEVRAYRRSIELGRTVERAAAPFFTAGYYWMWPFKAHTEKWLEGGTSPYKEEMDDLHVD